MDENDSHANDGTEGAAQKSLAPRPPKFEDLAGRNLIAAIRGPGSVYQMAQNAMSVLNSMRPPLHLFTDIQRINDTVARFNQFSTSLKPLLEMVENQRRLWGHLSRPISEVMAQFNAYQAYQNELSSRLRFSSQLGDMSSLKRHFEYLSATIPQRQPLFSRLLLPQVNFTEFVAKTVQRIESAENLAERNALAASLRVTEEQLVDEEETLTAIIATPTDSDAPALPRSQNVPLLQQDELLLLPDVDSEADLEIIIRASPRARATQLAQRVLKLIVNCNDAAKIAGKKEFFKPTTRLMEAFADVPWIAPVDKVTFGEFIDCFFFTFYEGAGDENLRFLTKHGGVLDPADCDFIWCVKFFRNKWLRHDPDHGGDSEIKKKWRDVATQFDWLELGHMPYLPEHFQQLHVRILQRAESFLTLLLERLAAS